uniref:Cortactin-binding protein-2 N-terminal domain-containing protein n=1 Tax=Periophthalmus magnuspinnatus TaxID=409849 RepID=A0A3B4A6W7_9GOBI
NHISSKPQNMKAKRRHSQPSRGQLSRDDLLFLLSILEGELQARDEVIAVLKSERTDREQLGAHYGESRPDEAFRALHRDSLRAQRDVLQDVCNPTAPVPLWLMLTEHHMRRIINLMRGTVSCSHYSTIQRLEEQEKKHQALVHKSNTLIHVLEQDRQRWVLKLLIAKETEYQQIKQERNEKEVSTLKEELRGLKAFALLVAKEHQLLTEELGEQKDRVKKLSKITENLRSGTFYLGQEKQQVNQSQQCTMTAKQAGLEEKRPLLRKTDGFWELNSKGHRSGGPGLMSEVEVLRRRVVEMEGKDEELIRMGEQCRELEQRLTKEKINSSNLRDDVDKLNKRINELDRIEGALAKSRQECGALKGSLEREKEVCKTLNSELDKLRVRLRESEVCEGQLQQSEAAIKQDLAHLRSLTVALVEDRNTMKERLRQAEETLSKRNEQGNLAMMPNEKLREERQQAARSQADLQERIKGISKEKDELRAKLRTEGERSSELEAKLSVMKRRLQVLENRREKEEKRESVKYGSVPNISSHQCQTQNNKVNELSQELERLRKTLQDKEVLEGALMKMEEDYEVMGRKFTEEQRRTQVLAQELEVAKCEVARYQQAEKEETNQEHQLLQRLQREQVKSRLLTRELESLKEKLQSMMGTEDSISKVQNDHSTLQRKLTQQENRNRELAREMLELSDELNRYKTCRNVPYDTNRFVMLRQTKEVQTDPNDIQYSASISPNQDEDKDEEDPNQNTESSSHVQNLNNLNSANNNISVYSNNGSGGVDSVNREVMMLTHTSGQPLHIKVTPHHMLNTATLEISSPSSDVATSYTSTAVIPNSPGQSKQRITIIQNANSRSPPSSPDRTLSLSTSPIARVMSPNSSRSVTPEQNSPIQIVTVRTCSPELEAAGLCKSLERQSSLRHERSNSTDTSSSISSLDDSKIHIHLGSPYIQALNGMSHSIPHSPGPYYVRHEQRTQVLANGCHVKGVGKITSSITISPATSPVSHSSNITVSGLCD